tara:strand:+ start:697 stop:831 length:135 start_codon:yes stop_codon:yes gene_type:complete
MGIKTSKKRGAAPLIGSRREHLLAIDLAHHGLGHLEENPIRWRR